MASIVASKRLFKKLNYNYHQEKNKREMRRGAGEEVKDNQLFVWSSTLINKYLLTINGQN